MMEREKRYEILEEILCNFNFSFFNKQFEIAEKQFWQKVQIQLWSKYSADRWMTDGMLAGIY